MCPRSHDHATASLLLPAALGSAHAPALRRHIPLLMWAALHLHASPLAHLSHAPLCLADPLPGSHRPAWSNRERPVSPGDGLGYVQPPRGLGSQSIRCILSPSDVGVSRWSPPTPAQVSGINYTLPGLSWMQSSSYSPWTLSCPSPAQQDPLISHAWSSSALREILTTVKKPQQTSSEGRRFQLRKASVLNSAHPSTLKTSPGSTNTTAAGQPPLLVAGKAKLFLFSERCRWSRCRVGVDFISYVEHEGSQKGWGEAGAATCNGAVGSQEVPSEPDHTVAPDPLPHFQQRGTLQLL